MTMTKRILPLLLMGISCLTAKTAAEYFQQGAYLYADAKYPTAAIEVREGLAKNPSDSKLQMLLKRIEEAMKEQQDKNQKENPGDSNSDSNSSSSGSGSSSNSGDSKSSNSKQGQSSAAQNPGQSSGSEGSSSSQSGGDSLQAGELNRDQAEQLLKDFQESDKERKRNMQIRGRAVPEKDW